jgi:hypothetical protein
MATEISPPSLWTEAQMAIRRLWGTTWERGKVSWRLWLAEIRNQGLRGKGMVQRTVLAEMEHIVSLNKFESEVLDTENNHKFDRGYFLMGVIVIIT